MPNYIETDYAYKKNSHNSQTSNSAMSSLKDTFFYLKPFLYIILLGLISALIFIGLDFNEPEWRALYILIFIVLSWIVNYIDIVIVGFYPLILGSLLLIMPLSDIMATYVTTTTLLYTTASMVGGAFQKHGVDRRFALYMMTGSTHQMFDITWRFAVVATVVSLWISDTASMTLLIPILQKMLNMIDDWNYKMELEGYKDPRVFKPPQSRLNRYQVKIVSFLVLSYSTCIGGMGTMIGSTTNFAFLNQFEQQFGTDTDLTFTLWFAYGIPIAIVTLFFCWICAVICWEGPVFTWNLAKYDFKSIYYKIAGNNPNNGIVGVKEYYENCNNVLEKAGKWTFAQIILTAVFPIVIILLFLRDPGIPGFGGWDSLFGEGGYTHDSMVTTLAAILVFALPAYSTGEIQAAIKNNPEQEEAIKEKMINERIINWKEGSAAVEWGVMWIFGGGYALATLITESGLNHVLADGIQAMIQDLSQNAVIFISCLAGSIFTEFMSSTNVINILTPVLNTVALELRYNPLMISYQAVFTAASGTLLPISTTSNVLAYKYANVTVPQMFRTGLLFKLFSIIIVFLFAISLGDAIFNFSHFPQWAQDFIDNNPNF